MECTEIDLNKVCRTCKNEAPEMKSLYYRDSESGKENPRLDEMLMACASVQVDTEDSLPKLICRSCFVQLKNAYTFKEQCEKTDVFLRDYVQNINNIKEETGLPDLEFTASEVVCEIKPLASSGESTERDTTEEITDDVEVQLDEGVEKDGSDYIQIVDNNVTIYKCRVCSKEFYTLEGLRCHKRLHTGKAFKCKQCDRCYTRLNHLQRHELSHSKRKMHVCKICNKTLTRYEHLKRHLITHLKDRPFSCPSCNRGFNRVERLENHTPTCKGKKVHVCDICNKAFLREDSMEVHKRLHENKDPVLPTLENLNNIEEHYMKIDLDDEANVFSDEEDFYVVEENMEPEVEVSENNDQMKIDEIAQITNDIYAEEDPPEMLLEKAKIEEELLLVRGDDNDAGDEQTVETDNGNDYESDNNPHSEYKPTKESPPKIKGKFQCKTCEKTFISKSNLTEHMKFHNDSSKKFLCSECGQMFLRHDDLIIHMRRHRGEKPFKCKFCGKGFPRTTDLTVHERYHTGEKTHLCVVCGRGFGRAYNLTVHMRTHTGERPYRCTYCDAAFAQGNDLKAHVRRHTGERFHCELCPETFLMGYLLTQHKRVVHGLNIVSNIRRLQPLKKLNPDDPPPVTVPLPAPIIVSNTLTSDPLQINQDDMPDLKQE